MNIECESPRVAGAFLCWLYRGCGCDPGFVGGDPKTNRCDLKNAGPDPKSGYFNFCDQSYPEYDLTCSECDPKFPRPDPKAIPPSPKPDNF